jgi:Fe-S oxidoreductase
MQQEKKGSIKLDFTNPLGKVSYHAACHQRVQNFGAKTRDFLNLIPDTEVSMIERCSGHDGIYAVKSESYEKSLKIVRPVQRQVNENSPEHIGSDCPMAGRLITHNLKEQNESMHPISMVRYAYGL